MPRNREAFQNASTIVDSSPYFYLRMDLERGPFLEMYGIKRNPKQVNSAQNTRPVYCSVSFTRYSEGCTAVRD
jgi:hypothetical protein